MKDQFKYADLTSQIIGAAFEVHKELGCGFQEVVYQRALEIEFKLQSIPHKREFNMQIWYKGFKVARRRVDFFVYDKISVEIKAKTELEDKDLAQALNYLEVYNLEIGLLLNFGSKSVQVKRLLNLKYKSGDPDLKD